MDWPKVQGIAANQRITVLLMDDAAPGGQRKEKGKFVSGTNDRLTIRCPDGDVKDLQRLAVRRVSVRRPILKRYNALVIAGITAAIAAAITSQEGVLNLFLGDDFTKYKIARSMAIWGGGAGLISSIKSSHKVIYNIPRIRAQR
ncbi:MAG: hypothetical protein OXN89_10660 [Bryobacterales bacterium]|nr:hypothetical protein [Bryobacterales bacterium]